MDLKFIEKAFLFGFYQNFFTVPEQDFSVQWRASV